VTVKLYVIHDRVAGEYGPIYQAVNDGVAKRQFLHYVKDTVDQADYRLYTVGDYDTVTADIIVKTPSQVVMQDVK